MIRSEVIALKAMSSGKFQVFEGGSPQGWYRNGPNDVCAPERQRQSLLKRNGYQSSCRETWWQLKLLVTEGARSCRTIFLHRHVHEKDFVCLLAQALDLRCRLSPRLTCSRLYALRKREPQRSYWRSRSAFSHDSLMERPSPTPFRLPL